MTRKNLAHRIERRRREAIERQERYDALTLEQKVTRASAYPDSKEYRRLVGGAA